MKYTVKQARMLKGITQEKMADMMNVCRDTYRRIELDPSSATISQGMKIAEITGIGFESIIFCK